MIRLGGTASNSHMAAFRGISRYFQRRGIDLDWLLYSDYDPLVDAFVAGEVDLAWTRAALVRKDQAAPPRAVYG